MNYQLKKPLTFDLKVKYNEIDKFLYPKLNIQCWLVDNKKKNAFM